MATLVVDETSEGIPVISIGEYRKAALIASSMLPSSAHWLFCNPVYPVRKALKVYIFSAAKFYCTHWTS